MPSLTRGATGPLVRELQQLLTDRGYAGPIDGTFALPTLQAVKAFQSENLDQLGQPLVVDGRVGPLTWWSLQHPKPIGAALPGVDFTAMPPGGSASGRAALGCAIEEKKLGAGEIGGNNCGPYVRKYLNGLAPEGSSWCAAFVSWVYHTGARAAPLFDYTIGARALLSDIKSRGWDHAPGTGYQPVPGDIVVWWRVKLNGWQGHAGLVHQLKDGMLYTVEGNRSPQVQGFSYVESRIDRLLGYGHVS